MADLEKIAYAKIFIDKMANGINPIDDSQIPENDLINNVRISRCLFFVSSVLGDIGDNGGIQKPKKKRKDLFKLSEDSISNFPLSDTPLPVSQISAYFNEHIDVETMKKFPVTAITNWLLQHGYLTELEKGNGRHYKMPTEKGVQIGITTEQRFGQNGSYIAILYGIEAQKLILENLLNIIESFNEQKQQDKEYQNQGQLWSKEEEGMLVSMFKDGLTVAEMSKTLQRTPTGIRARLKYLGLISNRNEAL